MYVLLEAKLAMLALATVSRVNLKQMCEGFRV